MWARWASPYLTDIRCASYMKFDKVSSRRKQFWQPRKLNVIRSEAFQTWGRSMTSCVSFGLPEKSPRYLHLCQDFLQLSSRKVPEIDFTYYAPIALLKCCNDVARA
jgi:hypothetical protein